MKAVGNYIIIKKIKEGTTKTEGGLYLSEADKQDIRYVKAEIVSVADDSFKLKKGDVVFYDKHAGHRIEYEDNFFYIIKLQDIVVVV